MRETEKTVRSVDLPVCKGGTLDNRGVSTPAPRRFLYIGKQLPGLPPEARPPACCLVDSQHREENGKKW